MKKYHLMREQILINVFNIFFTISKHDITLFRDKIIV